MNTRNRGAGKALISRVLSGLPGWLRQHREKTRPAFRAPDVRDFGNYHSVAISNCNNPCEAVQRLKDNRFLPAEAPVLPLQGCTAQSCQCRYVHYDDRREDDRRNPYGRYSSAPPAFIEQDRRNKSGRRNTDLVELDEYRLPDYF